MAFLPIIALGRIGALAGRGLVTVGAAAGRGIATGVRGAASGARTAGRRATYAARVAKGGVNLVQLRAAQAANTAISDNSQEDLERKARGHNNNVVAAVRAAARARGAQARILAPTVEWTNRSFEEKNQIAQITMGGNRPIGRRGAPAYALAFGSEFGSRIHRQFPLKNRRGWWFYRTVMASWARGDIEGKAGDEAVRQWAGPTKQHD